MRHVSCVYSNCRASLSCCFFRLLVCAVSSSWYSINFNSFLWFFLFFYFGSLCSCCDSCRNIDARPAKKYFENEKYINIRNSFVTLQEFNSLAHTQKTTPNSQLMKRNAQSITTATMGKYDDEETKIYCVVSLPSTISGNHRIDSW